MEKNKLGYIILLMMTACTHYCQVTAQEVPLVYDVENSVAPFNVSLPAIEDLPTIETLPDPFAWSDGTERST